MASPQMLTGGYDAPAKIDLLDRGRFVADVYRIAKDTKPNWSVRIGVYGGWGSGKTTVLDALEAMARRDRHVVVKLNAWRHASSMALWRAFVADLVKNVDEVEAKALKKVWWKTTVGTWGSALRKLMDATEISKTLATVGSEIYRSDFLAGVVHVAAEDFAALRESLANRRVIVFIDDVDRAQPQLLPNLLFSLKEVLDLPGFSFILAFDPKRVGEALQEQHGGWGTEFVEKIVDFPRYLPEPTTQDILALVKNDIAESRATVDVGAIERSLDLWPRNPRLARQFVRHLWSLGPEAARYGADELNWTLIIVGNLIKTKWPRLVHRFFEEVTDEAFFMMASRIFETERSRGRHEEFASEIARICDLESIDASDRAEVLRLWRALAEHAGLGFLPTPQIRRHVLLVEDPVVVTQKELDELLLVEEQQQDIAQWLDAHLARHGFKRDQLLRGLFVQAMAALENRLGAAADEIEESRLLEQALAARRVLSVLRVISLGQEHGFTGPSPALGAAHFALLYKHVSRWAPWNNHATYRELRGLEEALIVDVVNAASDVGTLFGALDPIARMRSEKSAEAAAIGDVIEAIADARVSATVIERFRQPEGIHELRRNKEFHLGPKALLLLSSRVWQEPSRARFLSIDRSRASAVVAENVVFWLDMLKDEADSRRFTDPKEDLVSKDGEIMRHAWYLLSTIRVNPRMFSRVRSIGQFIEKSAGITLAKPPWWSEAEPSSSGVMSAGDVPVNDRGSDISDDE